MTTIVGGLRARLIRDSLYHMIYDALNALEWFDPARKHKPVHFTGHGVDPLTEIPFNTLALADEGLTQLDTELGSRMVETSWTFYIDFYGENDVVAKDIINDIRDILSGRMSSIGRGDPSCVVYDYRQATPTAIARVDLENIMVDRAHDFPKPWLKYWYACRFTVVDVYDDDSAYSAPVPIPAAPDIIIDGGPA